MSNRPYTTVHHSRRQLGAYPGVIPAPDELGGFLPLIDNGNGTAWLIDTGTRCGTYTIAEREARDLAVLAPLCLESLARVLVPRHDVVHDQRPHRCLADQTWAEGDWCEACAIEDALHDRDTAVAP